MSNFIVIRTSRRGKFIDEAAIHLQAAGYDEINENTFEGGGNVTTVARGLKNLESYKKEKASHRIRINYGSLNLVT